MEIVSNIFYFVIVIGVLILIHEFGHFIAARMTGMRAEIFCIGMGNRLFGYHKELGFTFGPLPKDFDTGEYTDYRVALLPIGGFVKISGMVDESMDKDYVETEPKPWEFRSKNTLQKIFVLSAGVLMNFLLAIIIFSGIIFFEGEDEYATTKIAYVEENTLAEKIGFMQGDEIVSVNNQKITNWNQFLEALTTKELGKERKILINRNNQQETLTADGGQIIKDLAEQRGISIYPEGLRTLITSVETLKPAGKAGIQKGDTLLTVAGTYIGPFTQLQSVLQKNKNKTIEISWKRGNKTISSKVTPNENGMIGIGITNTYNGKIDHIDYNIIESISFGFDQTVSTAGMIVGSVVQIFKGNLTFKQTFGGPIMIARQASQQAEMGINYFLNFIAMLSISLAIINIVPFPALDGGHIIFVAIEGIIRRELSVKVKMIFQQVGIALLLIFMAIIIYNDIVR